MKGVMVILGMLFLTFVIIPRLIMIVADLVKSFLDDNNFLD